MKKLKRIASQLLSAVMIFTFIAPIVGYAADDVESINLYDGYLTMEKEFVTEDPDDSGRDLFQDTYTNNSVLYNLTSVTDEIYHEEVIEGKTVTYSTPRAGSVEEVEEPDEYMDVDGVEYVLISKNLVETTSPGETTHVQQEVTFEGIDNGESVPSYAEITVTDPQGNNVTQNFPLLGIASEQNVWADTFEFPILFTGYDADIIYLNGVEIDKYADLTSYSTLFLNYLGLDPADYDITSIEWAGPEYESGGVVYRQAMAYGRKLQKNIVALYGGDIVLGDQNLFHYECIYKETDPTGEPLESSIYTILSTARYDMEESIIEQEPEPMEPEPEAPDKNIFQRFAEWIKDNPIAAVGIGTLFLVVAIVIILFIIARRRRDDYRDADIYDFDEDDDDDY